MTTYRNGRPRRHSEDPARWREEPRAAKGAAQLILRSVCRPQTARPAELARLEAAVRRISSVPPPRGRSGRRYLTVGAAAVAMLGALGAASAVWRYDRVTAVKAPVLIPVVRAAAPDRSASLPHAPARRTASPTRHHHHAPHAVAGVRDDGDALAAETALVDLARVRLSPAPTESLAALERHRRLFPDGQLSAEREFLATAALARLGRTAEARRRAAALESHYPESSYAARATRLIPDGAPVPGTL
jgi:hypothetical protein